MQYIVNQVWFTVIAERFRKKYQKDYKFLFDDDLLLFWHHFHTLAHLNLQLNLCSELTGILSGYLSLILVDSAFLCSAMKNTIVRWWDCAQASFRSAGMRMELSGN